jgi:phosphatidylserine synthase
VLDLLGGTTLEHMTFTNGLFLHRQMFYKSKPNQFRVVHFSCIGVVTVFLLFLVFTKTKHRFLKITFVSLTFFWGTKKIN